MRAAVSAATPGPTGAGAVVWQPNAVVAARSDAAAEIARVRGEFRFMNRAERPDNRDRILPAGPRPQKTIGPLGRWFPGVFVMRQ